MSLSIMAILCGLVAVLYGIITSRSVLAASAGTPFAKRLARSASVSVYVFLYEQSK